MHLHCVEQLPHNVESAGCVPNDRIPMHILEFFKCFNPQFTLNAFGVLY